MFFLNKNIPSCFCLAHPALYVDYLDQTQTRDPAKLRAEIKAFDILHISSLFVFQSFYSEYGR